MVEMSLAEELAKHEVGWWRAHHKKDFLKAKEDMVKEYVLLFKIPAELAEKSVDLRIEAAKMHDLAEELEDEGKIEEAEEYWKKAEELLTKHFEVLLDAKKGS